MTKRRDLVLLLTKNGFWSVGGTRHEKFTNGKVTVLVKRHREIEDIVARKYYDKQGYAKTEG